MKKLLLTNFLILTLLGVVSAQNVDSKTSKSVSIQANYMPGFEDVNYFNSSQDYTFNYVISENRSLRYGFTYQVQKNNWYQEFSMLSFSFSSRHLEGRHVNIDHPIFNRDKINAFQVFTRYEIGLYVPVDEPRILTPGLALGVEPFYRTIHAKEGSGLAPVEVRNIGLNFQLIPRFDFQVYDQWRLAIKAPFRFSGYSNDKTDVENDSVEKEEGWTHGFGEWQLNVGVYYSW